MAAIPLVGWTLFTGVCTIPLLKGIAALAEWLEERPDGSISKGKSNSLIPLTASALAFGAIAYGFGFGGIAGIAGGATTEVAAQAFSAPSTPTVDVTVFAATGDSLFWLGSAFSADPGDTHDSTQLQIDTIGTSDWTSPVYTDSVTTALERDTVPPLTVKAQLDSGAVAKARIRYYGREGGWSAWSDSLQFTMTSLAVPSTPTHDGVVFGTTSDSLRLLGAAYVGAGSHDSTQWSLDTAGTAIDADSGLVSPLFFSTVGAVTTDTVPTSAIDSGAVYISRVRYKNGGGWSAWSDTLKSYMTPADLILWNAGSYADSAAMKNDTTPGGTFTAGADATGSLGGITLDDTLASKYGYTQAMRYDFNHTSDGCETITVRRDIGFPVNTRGVWLEIDTRWSANFATSNAACAPNDHKWLFGDTKAALNGRWAFKVGTDSPPNHSFKLEHPNTGALSLNDNPGTPAADAWDGEWHNVKIYWENSTTCSSNDGASKIWFDNVLWHDSIGFNTCNEDTVTPDSITGISFHRNKDDGPDNVSMSTWFLRIRAYSTNPGW